MKIVHLAKFYHPFKGGMETVVKNLCEGSSKDNKVEVICANTGPTSTEEIINQVTVKRLANYGVVASQPLVPGIMKCLKGLENVDLFHLHTPNPLFELSTLLCLPKSTPLVVTHHSDIVKQKILGKFYLPLLRKFYGRANKIIVPTKNHVSSSVILPEFSEKIEISPFGISLGNYPNSEEVGQRAGEFKKKYDKYFIFIGRLVNYKGVKYLIEAMADVEAKLVICGKGPLEKELRELAGQLSIAEKIMFLGEIKEQKDLCSLIKGSQGLVLPSISNNENFGMVQLEAMAYKVPVIATSLKSGASTIVDPNKTGFIVKPKNSNELTVALNELLSDPEKSAVLGNAGHERLLKDYTFEAMIDKHLKIYGKLLKDK